MNVGANLRTLGSITASECANVCTEIGGTCEAWAFEIEDSTPICFIYGQQIEDNLAGTAAADWNFGGHRKGVNNECSGSPRGRHCMPIVAGSITATDGLRSRVCFTSKSKRASCWLHGLARRPSTAARDHPACVCARHGTLAGGRKEEVLGGG